MPLPRNGGGPALAGAGPQEQCRASTITPAEPVHALDILAWLRGAQDVVDAIRDGTVIRPESVQALLAAEPSPDLAKALAMGLAAQKLAVPSDIDAAFRAWPELLGA